MMAEISKFDPTFPDNKYEDTTTYTGVVCSCGRCNFVKRKNIVIGDNPITCPECGFTAVLVHTKNLEEK